MKMLLDFFGGVFLTAAMVVNVNALVSTLQISRSAKLLGAALVGLWIGTQVSLATAGAFGSDFALVFPLIGLMVALPVLAVAAGAWSSPGFREALMALPMPMLVGLNVSRVFGVFFLLLLAEGRMGGPFPFSAGWGDVITGLVALPLAILAARRLIGPNSIWVWNAFGALDLVAAIVLGTISFNGGLGQLLFTGPGSNAIQFLPWSMIPTVLVPFYLIVHGVIFAQLRREARSPAAVLG
jgi:hypothetical protein